MGVVLVDNLWEYDDVFANWQDDDDDDDAKYDNDDDDNYQQVNVLELKVFKGISHWLNYFFTRKRLSLCPDHDYVDDHYDYDDNDDYSDIIPMFLWLLWLWSLSWFRPMLW